MMLQDVALEEVLRDGDGERGAFIGVGGGAELVDEDERAFTVALGCKFNDAVDVADVRGEGGEILLDGLRVADVGEDAGEDGQACGLRQERERRPAPSRRAGRRS